MVTKVIMPKFGLSMETGVLGSWLVEEGDSVTKGSALAEITTDKIHTVDKKKKKKKIGELNNREIEELKEVFRQMFCE